MDALEGLHSLIAGYMKEDLQDELKRTPQLYAQVIKFLQANGVEPARDADNKALQELADEIGKIASSGSADDVKSIIN